MMIKTKRLSAIQFKYATEVFSLLLIFIFFPLSFADAQPLKPEPNAYKSVPKSVLQNETRNLASSGTGISPEEASPQIPSGLINLSEEDSLSKYSFVVDKSKRIIEVYETIVATKSSAGSGIASAGSSAATETSPNNTTSSTEKTFVKKIAAYSTDIGKNTGDKQKENDAKTPVGIYFLQKELTQPEIPFETYGNLAFTTDYPNIFDKRDYKTGSGIWLHAVPDSVPLTRGSRGCVVVRNDVIKSLKQYFKPGKTPILIYDEIQYLKPDEHFQQKQRYQNEIEKWRTAWEKQDVDTYIKYYDETFKNNEMNYKQWYKHKRKLKRLYSYIKVQLGKPLILANKEQVVIRVTQKYQSDLHEDHGIKTIHGRLDPKTGFKIIREEWMPIDQITNNKTESVAKDQRLKDIQSKIIQSEVVQTSELPVQTVQTQTGQTTTPAN